MYEIHTQNRCVYIYIYIRENIRVHTGTQVWVHKENNVLLIQQLAAFACECLLVRPRSQLEERWVVEA